MIDQYQVDRFFFFQQVGLDSRLVALEGGTDAVLV